jgi:hypothetical protein
MRHVPGSRMRDPVTEWRMRHSATRRMRRVEQLEDQ